MSEFNEKKVEDHAEKRTSVDSDSEDNAGIESDVAEFSISLSWGNLQPSDFFFGSTLGEGAFARVVLAKRKGFEHLELAIKIMEKTHIKKENKIKHVMCEKQILTMLNRNSHPFIIK